MSMSFNEKSTWVSLVIVLLVWSNYFLGIYPGLLEGSLTREDSAWRFVVVVVTIIVLQIASHIVLAITNLKQADEPRDERDRLISLRAEMPGGVVLAAGVITLAVTLMFRDLSSLLVANVLLALLVLSSIVTYVLQIFWYRRGF